MSIVRGFDIAASGMSAQRTRLNIVSSQESADGWCRMM